MCGLKNYHEIIHVASLTNRDLVVAILIDIKSCGILELLHWLLWKSTTTSTTRRAGDSDTVAAGQHTFLILAQCASELKLLPSEWSCFFQRAYEDDCRGEDITNNNKEKPRRNHKNNVMLLSTSQLITNTLRHIPDESHLTRLQQAIEMIELNSIDKSSTTTTISIHEAASLVKASTVKVCKSLQSRIMSILLNLCASQSGNETNENILHALASVQLPLLQSLDQDVSNELFFHNTSFQFDDRITTLFQYHEKGHDGIHKNSSSNNMNAKGHASMLKLIGLVEAANLARLGNQIGSKHGCVITVSKDVIRKNAQFLKAIIEKSEYLNLHVDMDQNDNDTPYDVIVGKGYNHNVVPNGKGGKKRMIHAEVHAVADTIRMFGEDLAFHHIFPFATAIIVELKGDTSYDDAPPCPKCELLLRAVGVHNTCHSTKNGCMNNLTLLPYSNRSRLFRNPIVRVPFQTVCDELCIQCSKLALEK